MDLVEDAFLRLFPGVEFNYDVAIVYSGKFKPYNATVRKMGDRLQFNFSRSWETVSDEIVIGLVQSLLVRILRKDKSIAAAAEKMGRKGSLNMQLYEDFIKGISEVPSTGTSSDERLESSFNRVNQKYFLGLMDKPNLKWGNDSFRKLACYEYHTNTISVSSLFADAPEHLLDYLMYHELLHKKLKFSSSNGRTRHHGTEFRRMEEGFDGSSTIENELNSFLRASRRTGRRVRRLSWRQLLMFQ